MNILRITTIFIFICHLSVITRLSAQEVFLSDLSSGFIANPFGPPNNDLSWSNLPISIRGNTYEKGLGVHAPSQICLDINGNGLKLQAVIGMDDENSIEAGTNDHPPVELLQLPGTDDIPSVRFLVKGDGRLLFSSGWVTERTAPIPVVVDIRAAEQICLIVEHGPSGPGEALAHWADARITVNDVTKTDQLSLYNYPAGILINQAGFIPSSVKTFRLAGLSTPVNFEVIDQETQQVVFNGTTTIKSGDWGTVSIGDFSSLTKPGHYFITSGNQHSIPFRIHPLQYVKNLETHLNWFLWQRCGDPENGWERGQHQDDGVRLDNYQHQDVSGGWHDAADLRKWGMTINGLWALSEIYLTMNAPGLKYFEGKRNMILRIKDELAWGNKYFHAMQEPQGYLMNQVGGDVYAHGDNNRFTDNISGTPDDRWIVTTPNAPVFQYMFVISQCNISLAEGLTPENPYLEKAIRCFKWSVENRVISNIHELGAVLTASLKLYQATGKQEYLEKATSYLNLLLNRQNTKHRPMNGFMGEWDPDNPEAERTYPAGQLSYQLITPNFPIWSIVESIRLIDDPALNKKARNAFDTWANNFIGYFDKKSSYGIVPMALYADDPGGNRKAGEYYYRWCYVNRENDYWWNGINPRIGYAGACLVRGGLLTNNQEALRIGQQQIDFIYGCNPFNASTVTGIGFNQPEYFKTSEYVPHTPLINGAVMAGIGSSDKDLPVLLPAWWQTTEYWMEAVCGTIMLLNELNRYELRK